MPVWADDRGRSAFQPVTAFCAQGQSNMENRQSWAVVTRSLGSGAPIEMP